MVFLRISNSASDVAKYLKSRSFATIISENWALCKCVIVFTCGVALTKQLQKLANELS